MNSLYSDGKRHNVLLALLATIGLVLTLLVFSICHVSHEFALETDGSNRPIPLVLILFVIAFMFYGAGWFLVGGFGSKKRCTGDSIWVLLVIVGFGVLFRGLAVSSQPIQEVDIYRYIWDGAVVGQQIDPYIYSPRRIKERAFAELPKANQDELHKLDAVLKSRPGLSGVLNEVHFAHYTTPYPPASQLVFAAAVAVVPHDGEVVDYLRSMKIALVLFDIGTGLLVILLLGHAGLSRSLCLAYFWCPLVIKEVANSGHLDSITVFFVTLSIYLLAKAFWSKRQSSEIEHEAEESNPSLLFCSASAVVMAAAIAGKIFPIVLVPIWCAICIRRFRRLHLSVIPIAVLAICSCVFMWPMLRHLELSKHMVDRGAPDVLYAGTAVDPSGVEAFSKYWEMNDLLFMVIVENLKPDSGGESLKPWFAFTNNKFRESIVETFAPVTQQVDVSVPIPTPANRAFWLTRKITLAIFGLIVLWFCVSVFRQPSLLNFLERCFLILAWFWLLSPTQNPWYWIWAMALLPFAKGRAWFLVSGVLFAYYLRFYFEYQFANQNVMGTGYQGTLFFDFVVPWLEFGPIIVWLAGEWLVRLASRVGALTE